MRIMEKVACIYDWCYDLLTEKDKELIINHKDEYLNNENIIFTADLRNPSQELTNEPDLRIRIINRYSKKIYEYDFSRNDNSYYLNVNSLPEGIYNFTAEAKFGNKTYSETGNFSVVPDNPTDKSESRKVFPH